MFAYRESISFPSLINKKLNFHALDFHTRLYEQIMCENKVFTAYTFT